jgi:hypothetical protein
MGTPPTGGATPTTPTNATPPTPARPAPRELCALTFDFQTNTPNPGPPPAPGIVGADCGTVTAGYTKLTISGNFTSGEPLMLANAIAVKILDASGAPVLIS